MNNSANANGPGGANGLKPDGHPPGGHETVGNKEAANDKIYSSIALYSQLGFSMSACVVLGIFGGIYLDRWLGTSPLCLFAGCLIGTGASFKALYDLVVKKAGKRPEKRSGKRPDKRSGKGQGHN